MGGREELVWALGILGEGERKGDEGKGGPGLGSWEFLCRVVSAVEKRGRTMQWTEKLRLTRLFASSSHSHF